MSQVVSCDPQALATICARLRQIGEQLDSHATTSDSGGAFHGAAPGTAESFADLCSETAATRGAVAEQVRSLAAAIENAAQAFEHLDQSMTNCLEGHVT